MLSLLSAMLAVPMEELTPQLPLRKEILDALQGAINREGRMLAWLKGHESGDWSACEAIVASSGLRSEQVNHYYAEAVLWADNQFRMVE